MLRSVCSAGRWDCWCRRSAGWRFGPYVGQAIPLMVEAWQRAPEEDDDLRELSLAALEGFVLRCPQASRCIPPLLQSRFGLSAVFSQIFHMTASNSSLLSWSRDTCLSHTHVACRGHLDAILGVVQASLSYDPNYADDMEEDENEDREEDEDE